MKKSFKTGGTVGATGTGGPPGPPGPAGPTGPAGPAPSGAANLVLATPNGAPGVSSLRALVQADLPFQFADEETPAGAIDGVNTVFTLAHSPSPAKSLALFYNGLIQKSSGGDFTLSPGNTITFVSAPTAGSTLLCWYRF